MFRQKASDDPFKPIFWDYHVILLVPSSEPKIIDFDTTLSFCSDMDEYLSLSLPNIRTLKSDLQPIFRIIRSCDYARNFSSNRQHMIADGAWLAEPPSWPCVGSGKSNFHDFINPKNTKLGTIFNIDDLLNQPFSKKLLA